MFINFAKQPFFWGREGGVHCSEVRFGEGAFTGVITQIVPSTKLDNNTKIQVDPRPNSTINTTFGIFVLFKS